MPAGIGHEIIVVDNDSSDGTAAVARDRGADKVFPSSGTVAAARNLGAGSALGDVLVFLDADVSLTAEWGTNLQALLNRVDKDSKLISGSWVSVPENASWLERSWFRPMEVRPHSHVNSGHMIIPHRFFDELNGFDPALESGEDYDISTRALRVGGRLEPDQRLRAIHHGYPKTLCGFFNREVWHGQGDATSLGSIVRSAPAVAGIALLGALVAIPVAAAYVPDGRLSWFLVALTTFLPLIVSLRMFRHEGLLRVGLNLPLTAIYLIARGYAVVAAVFGLSARRNPHFTRK